MYVELSHLFPAVTWIIYYVQNIIQSVHELVHFTTRLSNQSSSLQVLICFHQIRLLDTNFLGPNCVIRIGLLNFQSKKESKRIWESAMNMNMGYGGGYPLMPFDPNFPPPLPFNPFSFPKGWCWFSFQWLVAGLIHRRSDAARWIVTSMIGCFIWWICHGSPIIQRTFCILPIIF